MNGGNTLNIKSPFKNSPNATNETARFADVPEISTSEKNAIKYGSNDIVTKVVSRNV